ncbi:MULTISPECIES: haloacid dehalogenase [Geobacillus thermoleovorans group]|nr:haloacid dehalogenase [Geobacillus kaustophilus]MED4973987.1 haloacid dehalogenase [Geobacillus thermoleovorans]
MHGADIKAIVFDLDGTLYEETEHFDYYAEQVAKRLREADRPRFWDDYRAVLAACCRRCIFVLYIQKIIENIYESVYNKKQPAIYQLVSKKSYPMLLAWRLPQ